MEPEDLRKMIAQEIARPEIQRAIYPTRRRWATIGAALRHPVMVAVIGFFLTTLVGTFISQNIADRAQRDGELKQALEAVRSFATKASELRVQQAFLLEALEQAVPESELQRTKAAYDTAYLEWHATRYRNYLTIRSFFGFTYSNFAEQLISRTIHQDFRVLDGCLEQVYFADMRGNAVRDRMNACLSEQGREVPVNASNVDSVTHRQEKLFQCSRRIFDTLHHFIAKDINCTTSPWTARKEDGATVVSRIYSSVWDACGVGAMPEFDAHSANAQTYCTLETGFWP